MLPWPIDKLNCQFPQQQAPHVLQRLLCDIWRPRSIDQEIERLNSSAQARNDGGAEQMEPGSSNRLRSNFKERWKANDP
ncbi:unnamed protein product, partial [Mesorhabditis spiculigera]